MAFEQGQADGFAGGGSLPPPPPLTERIGNAISNVSNSVENRIEETKKNLGSYLAGGSNASPKILYFPEIIAQENNNFPYTRFSIVNGQTSIHLPIPPGGISVSDGADYSTIDLGLVGADLGGLMNRDGKVAASASEDNMAQKLTKGLMAGASIAAKSLGNDKVSEIIDFTRGSVTAKNTHVNFQSNQLRSYSFNFKLVAKTQKESIQAKKIVDTFRENIYGIMSYLGTSLEYPKPWKIQFFFNGAENPFLPYIKHSYLTSFSANYNSGSNMFHYDGSPIEIDISLSFQETKVLSRADVQFQSQEYANDNIIDRVRDFVDVGLSSENVQNFFGGGD